MIERIPDLPYNGLLPSNAKLPWYLPDDDTTYHINAGDIFAGLAGPDDAWNPDYSYSNGEISTSGGKIWISNSDDNLGNPPGPASAFWDEEPDPEPVVSSDFWPLAGSKSLTNNVSILGDNNNVSIGTSGDKLFNFFVYTDNNVGINASGGIQLNGSGTSNLSVGSGAVTVNKLDISTAPVVDNTIDDILVWDSGTNEVKVRDASSISGGGGWPLTGDADFTGDVEVDRHEFTFSLPGSDGLGADSVFELRPDGYDMFVFLDSFDYGVSFALDGQNISMSASHNVDLKSAQWRVETGSGDPDAGVYGSAFDTTGQGFYFSMNYHDSLWYYGEDELTPLAGIQMSDGAAVVTFSRDAAAFLQTGASLSPTNLNLQALDEVTFESAILDLVKDLGQLYVTADNTLEKISAVSVASEAAGESLSAAISCADNSTMSPIGSTISVIVDTVLQETRAQLQSSHLIRLLVDDGTNTGIDVSNDGIDLIGLDLAVVGADTPTHTVVMSLDGVEYKFFVKPV